MSKELQNSQYEQLIKRHIKLLSFQSAINDSIAEGYLDDMLKVQDGNGDYPIVAALGEEPLSLLVKRCRAIGGNANIFVLTDKGTRYITARTNESGSSEEEVLDLSDSGQWENGNADISFFVEWLLRQEKPVKLPGTLPCSLDMYNPDVKLKKDDDEDNLVSSL